MLPLFYKGDTMPKKPRLEVISESSTGLNIRFKDTSTKKEMTLNEAAKRVNKGEYPDYHVAKYGDKNVIRSNPDKSKNNNLD